MPHAFELSRIAQRFIRDRNGNFALIAGVTLPALVLAVGFAVDLSQVSGSKSRLANALDAALTSTARDISTGHIKEADAEKAALAFLLANAPGGFLIPGSVSFASFVIDKKAGTIDATVDARTALSFPLFGSGSSHPIQVSSATIYADKQVEVAMMLDITGSMGGQKLLELKNAAKRAVATFLDGQAKGSSRVRVAIVPYADAVNVGDLSNLVYYETSYTTGEPPMLGAVDKTTTTSTKGKKGKKGKKSKGKKGAGTNPDNCATERKGMNQFNDTSPYAAMINRDYRLAFCPKAEMEPLTSDSAALKASIDSFQANGYTAGHIGIQWSWYALSPKWARVLPTGSAPAKYNDTKTVKYAILMTDGEFNTAFADVPQRDNTRGGQSVRSRSYAEQLCTQMKKKGIEIFTIGFQLHSSNAKAVLKNCASPGTSSKHYFETSSGAELDSAFQEIAHNIQRLALTR